MISQLEMENLVLYLKFIIALDSKCKSVNVARLCFSFLLLFQLSSTVPICVTHEQISNEFARSFSFELYPLQERKSDPSVCDNML